MSTVIDGVVICPELVQFMKVVQVGIDNNKHKDKGRIRGWKTQTPALGMYKLTKEMQDVQETVFHMSYPIDGDDRNLPTREEALKEFTDAAGQLMHVADQHGLLEVS